MTVKDQYGHDLSGASVAAAEHYQKALDAYHCYAGDPFPLLQQAIADSPGFVMAHALVAYMTLVGADADTALIGVEAFGAAKTLPATAREAGHVAAIGNIIAGQIRAAGRILEDVAIDNPRDVLALQAGQLMDFVLGDSRMLRDRIARATPAWSADMPNYHAILGMHAFGLEETAHYERAEAAGREAIALNPRNNWAQHAVAHVLEMQDRRAEGVVWMRQDSETWSHESFFQTHNWWHLALFHLGLGEIDQVLALYDGPVAGSQSSMSVDMIDAAALLWRLKLAGVDVEARWTPLAQRFAAQPRGGYAFDDIHAVMAFVGAGQDREAQAAIAAMTAAVDGPGDNATASGQVGLPVAQALVAYGRGDYARACDLLRRVRDHAGLIGGSHAQRDLLDLTLISAAGRANETSLERALLAERTQAAPLVTPGRRSLAA
jgi:tetratricopeptide (TPR) repeat protein